MKNSEYNFRIGLIEDLKKKVKHALFERGYDIDLFGRSDLVKWAVMWARVYAEERGCSELTFNAIQNELMRYYGYSAFY